MTDMETINVSVSHREQCWMWLLAEARWCADRWRAQYVDGQWRYVPTPFPWEDQ
jgi:hypothetical protein